MLAAGGMAVTAGCSAFSHGQEMDGGSAPESNVVPCGNANPDPCICGRPDADPVVAMQCADEMACQADGGVYVPFYVGQPDGSTTPPHCTFLEGGLPGDDGG